MSPSPVNQSTEHLLLALILQLAVIITAARIFAHIFRRLGQPMVCGEIAAGLILGPSFLGRFFPGVFRAVFDPADGATMSLVSQLGLVLLMFLIGLEFDFSLLRGNCRTAASVSASGILLPFGLGFGLGYYMHSQLGIGGSPLNFALFMGTAMSITAIPILGRIMIEMNINRTRIGFITISAAAMDDAAGWIILALVTAIARSAYDPIVVLLRVGGVLIYVFVMWNILRPRLKRWTTNLMSKNEAKLPLDALAALLVMILCSAAVTNLIGVFSIFGGFVFGAILYDCHEFRLAVRERLHDFVSVFFLPVFFTYTGLRTDIGIMAGMAPWIFCGVVLIAAFVGKAGGCTLAAAANGMPWREASIIGIMMNTRALMELIVINIGYDLGIIPKNVFFMLVAMAVTTTYVTAPLLSRLLGKSEAEREYKQSQFVTANIGGGTTLVQALLLLWYLSTLVIQYVRYLIESRLQCHQVAILRTTPEGSRRLSRNA